jgi:hypothetical protein
MASLLSFLLSGPTLRSPLRGPESPDNEKIKEKDLALQTHVLTHDRCSGERSSVCGPSPS